ncbi:hypothetical protein NUW54_g11576 [Trametes sanguinea]|uniref:Uncharacterized protein n=1 Tax=Trametes sanguinea TaxID=158606 RepID=A0ACC1ND69_9APHY|nr:hypothetical protein NUW54_g11576 [Trametes sanguinea]
MVNTHGSHFGLKGRRNWGRADVSSAIVEGRETTRISGRRASGDWNGGGTREAAVLGRVVRHGGRVKRRRGRLRCKGRNKGEKKTEERKGGRVGEEEEEGCRGEEEEREEEEEEERGRGTAEAAGRKRNRRPARLYSAAGAFHGAGTPQTSGELEELTHSLALLLSVLALVLTRPSRPAQITNVLSFRRRISSALPSPTLFSPIYLALVPLILILARVLYAQARPLLKSRSKKDKPMSIVVKWGRERLHFPLPPPGATLGQLRHEIAEYTHLPEHSFKLIHAGAVMKDDNAPSTSFPPLPLPVHILPFT